MTKVDELHAWLENDESKSRSFRATRLEQLLLIFEGPDSDIMFFGGSTSHQTYLELRLAFIHGLYIATVILSLACVEQELAGRLYARGNNSSARDSLELLLKNAQALGEVSNELYGEIEKMRIIRNAYTHFRPPLHPDGQIARALHTSTAVDELSEPDAIAALKALARLLRRRP